MDVRALDLELPDADVLIVEDVDQVRYIAERILKSAGFRTLTASNGAEALELLERGSKVRLILTDLQMPVMGGRQLADHVSRRTDAPPASRQASDCPQPFLCVRSSIRRPLLD